VEWSCYHFTRNIRRPSWSTLMLLTPRGRLLLARRVVDDGWPIVRAAEHFHVSWPTAKRWAIRYAAMGAAGMADQSSRAHHSPNRTAAPVVRRVVELRWRHRLSPLAIASRACDKHSFMHIDVGFAGSRGGSGSCGCGEDRPAFRSFGPVLRGEPVASPSWRRCAPYARWRTAADMPAPGW
jgi:hypothetical protein